MSPKTATALVIYRGRRERERRYIQPNYRGLLQKTTLLRVTPMRQARSINKAQSLSVHVLLHAIEQMNGTRKESSGCAQCSFVWAGCHLHRKLLILFIQVITLPTIHTSISLPTSLQCQEQYCESREMALAFRTLIQALLINNTTQTIKSWLHPKLPFTVASLLRHD